MTNLRSLTDEEKIVYSVLMKYHSQQDVSTTQTNFHAKLPKLCVCNS